MIFISASRDSRRPGLWASVLGVNRSAPAACRRTPEPLGISPSLPIYVGESGQGSSTLSDSTQNTAENNFLYNSSQGAYAGLGIWDYGYVGDTDVYHMLESNGSWRPVCETILDFNP